MRPQKKVKGFPEPSIHKIYNKIKNTIYPELSILQDCFIVEEENKILTIWKNRDKEIHWQFWLVLEFLQELWLLIFEGFYVQNGKPIILDSYYSKQSAIRIFETLNNRIKNSDVITQYCFDPETGASSLEAKLLLNPMDLQNKNRNFYCTTFIQHNIAEMLSLSSRLYQTLKFHKGLAGPILRTPKQQQTQQNKKIETIVNVLESFSQLVNPKIEELENFSNTHQTLEFFLSNSQNFSSEFSSIIDQLCVSQLQFEDKKFTEDLLKSLEDLSEQVRYQQYEGQQNPIVQQIEILEQNEWVPFTLGSFCMNQRSQVSYRQVNGDGQIFKTQMCKKSEYFYGDKNRKQLEIIKNFKNQYHPNIMNYYLTTQLQYKRFVFTKYQPNMSMEVYLKKNKNTISLGTILLFLEKICRGLIFLKYKSIIHMDLKPGDVIVEQGLNIKIIDFAESIYRPKYQQLKHFTITPPYSPFELFRFISKRLINEKIDIFSMGVTIFKTIFKRHIWGKIQDHGNFMKKFKKNQIPKIICPEVNSKYGFEWLLKKLTKLSLEAVSQRQINRPSLDYMFFIIYLSRRYIEQIENTYSKPKILK